MAAMPMNPAVARLAEIAAGVSPHPLDDPGVAALIARGLAAATDGAVAPTDSGAAALRAAGIGVAP